MFNSPNAVLRGIRSEFTKQLRATPESYVKPFTFFTKSDGSSEIYHFLGAMPGLKEWIDKIGFKDFTDFKYEITNKSWELGVLVDRDTISDSKKILGPDIELQIRASVKEWVTHADELVDVLLVANGNAFDGVAFFANARPALQGTDAIDNLYTGTGITLAQLEADLDGSMTQLRGFKDINNKPINRGAKYQAFIPSHLERKFLELRNSTQINPAGVTKDNVLQNTFDIVVNDFQSTANNDWYLINEAASIPAFIYQTREEPFFKMKDDEEFKHVKYFSTGRHNAGYANPTSIIKIDN